MALILKCKPHTCSSLDCRSCVIEGWNPQSFLSSNLTPRNWAQFKIQHENHTSDRLEIEVLKLHRICNSKEQSLTASDGKVFRRDRKFRAQILRFYTNGTTVGSWERKAVGGGCHGRCSGIWPWATLSLSTAKTLQSFFHFCPRKLFCQ